MNYIKIQFDYLDNFKHREENKEEEIDLLWNYLSCLYKNGQILKDFELIKKEKNYLAFVTVAEELSLAEQYNNIYVKEELSKLYTIFSLSFKLIGENLNCNNSCQCKQPSCYILYTDYTCLESPIICGNCGNSIPLYKLPYLFSENEYFTILSWQKTYQSIDQIWMESLADHFSYQQLSNPNAQLTKIGRKICYELEKQLKKPVYYYLFHANHPLSNCPSCGKLLQKSNIKNIDYQCDCCRFAIDKGYSFH